MKIVKLSFCLLLLAGSSNLYSMHAPEGGDAKAAGAVIGATANGAAAAASSVAASIAARAAISNMVATGRGLQELASFSVGSEEFINLLHTWASKADVGSLRAAFEIYPDLKIAECKNSSGKTLLDSAEKAPEKLESKQACIEFLTMLAKISARCAFLRIGCRFAAMSAIDLEDVVDVLDARDNGGFNCPVM